MTTSPKITQKQEEFCQKYIETGIASEAYRLAYDADNMKPEVIWVKACELLKSGKVAVRIAELQEVHRKRHLVTVDKITAELEEARTLAMTEKQASAAVSASMGKAKIHGMLVEKQEHMGKDGGPIQSKIEVVFVKPGQG